MARVARQQAASAGVYGHLVDYFEADRAAWVANGNQTHAEGEPYPCQRILDGLRARESVNVPTWSLPKVARPTVRQVTGRMGNVVLSSPSRAVVSPDYSIRFTDKNWAALWLEENGIEQAHGVDDVSSSAGAVWSASCNLNAIILSRMMSDCSRCSLIAIRWEVDSRRRRIGGEVQVIQMCVVSQRLAPAPTVNLSWSPGFRSGEVAITCGS